MPYDPSLSAAIERQNADEELENAGARYERSHIEKILREGVMEMVGGYIADAACSVEMIRLTTGPNVPKDAAIKSMTSLLSKFEKIREELIEAFPSLKSVPMPDIEALTGKKPVT